MRPSGKLHLGNYLGGAKGMLALQGSPDYKTLYMVADLHAITTPYDKSKLRGEVREVVLDYLAIGLDPNKSAIFIQSDLADLHAQLAYYLSTVVTIARMQHLPTYKEKVKEFPNVGTMALLNYPVLMAADILIYQAHLVPVGIDQEPHLEITREIARKMNSQYGTHFPEPQRFATKGEYVPSLTGEGKMSKSVEGSCINLTDNLKTIKAKLAKVPTDGGQGKKNPGRLRKSETIRRHHRRLPVAVRRGAWRENAGNLRVRKPVGFNVNRSRTREDRKHNNSHHQLRLLGAGCCRGTHPLRGRPGHPQLRAEP